MTDPANIPSDFRRCVKCRHLKDESSFGFHHGKPTKTCSDCLEPIRDKYREDREAETTPTAFEVIRRVFGLTDDEAHAVDMAAGQNITRTRWRIRRKGEKWPGPTADMVITAESPGNGKRQRELLQATTHRTCEILHDQGIDPGKFFHRAAS